MITLVYLWINPSFEWRIVDFFIKNFFKENNLVLNIVSESELDEISMVGLVFK